MLDLLLEHDDDLLGGLEDVVQPDDAGRGRAQGQESDLVADLCAAVFSVARAAGELGREHLTRLQRPTAPHTGELTPATKTPTAIRT